jgi:predicted hydrolase (HD superfamily)
MVLPTKEEARKLLHNYVGDTYQRFHAEMVARCVEGYGEKYNQDIQLWWLTGYVHDIDYDTYPTQHPGPSLEWFAQWNYPEELTNAVEAHAIGFNGFSRVPATLLEKTLIACDEICGIFYAYQKLNPIAFGEMKMSSIKKRLIDERFAPGISRAHITAATEALGVQIDEHIENLIAFLATVSVPK